MPHRPAPGRRWSDHRRLNTEMDLFATDPAIGSGLPLWLPAGAVIRQELEQFARDIARRDGCLSVYSPVLAKRSLFEQSGHWAKFSDDMSPPMGSGPDDLVLRPANCPHHAMIYAARPHSYRELPVRLNELASMFRAERSGVLSGLSRVLQINLDDTHVFCRPDQVSAEVARALRSAVRAQRTLGLPIDHVRLSRRGAGDGYLGDGAEWERAEDMLRRAASGALHDLDLALVEAEGEAAFYGPKLDLQVLDGRGQEETIATVQLDFNQPERFDLTYTGIDGLPHRVVMIHRGTVGAVERVVAALLERYQGRLPLRLAPIQVCVLPIGRGDDDAARVLLDQLQDAGLRAVRETEGSLGARVRLSRRRRDCVLAVIGPAETAAGQVQVTDIGGDFKEPLPQRVLIDALRDAYLRRAIRIAWPAEPGVGSVVEPG